MDDWIGSFFESIVGRPFYIHTSSSKLCHHRFSFLHVTKFNGEYDVRYVFFSVCELASTCCDLRFNCFLTLRIGRRLVVNFNHRTHVFRRSLQISHARWAGEPSLLNNWAMLSGDIIGELRNIKGVALWLTGFGFFTSLGCNTALQHPKDTDAYTKFDRNEEPEI